MASYKLRVRDMIIIALCSAFLALPYFLFMHTPTVMFLNGLMNRSTVREESDDGPHKEMTSISSSVSEGSDLPNSNSTLSFSAESKTNVAPTPAATPALIPPSKKFEELPGLEDVLIRTSMPDKTVIITTLNSAWAKNNTMVDLFLESFQEGDNIAHLVNHILIVALDQSAYDRCEQIHHHCYRLETEGVDFAAEKFFMSSDYLKMMWRRIDFLRIVLELGYNMVFADADIMWFRDPFPHFSPYADFQIACDHFNGRPTDLQNLPNGGFVYVRSNNVTINFYKFWFDSRMKHPGKHDQDVFNDIKKTKAFARLGLKVEFLDTVYFGGFCEVSQDFEKVCTMHANCCTGLERKLSDLRLTMSDWRRFKNMTREEKRNQRIFWQAPKECLHSCKLKALRIKILYTLLVFVCIFCFLGCHQSLKNGFLKDLCCSPSLPQNMLSPVPMRVERDRKKLYRRRSEAVDEDPAS
ncbi:hypothetical protein R1flu_023989 [Riccia fluitans]|uniref:Nucleotide-diphospho-sugar transferase domain-containing protein n=1 Tax=Riccia fluitans TaxID=41844 RepID=A0ABD1XTS6_9MARC